jgi:osmotically-inducible protein OsmY
MQATLVLPDAFVPADVLTDEDAAIARCVHDSLAKSRYMPLRVLVHCQCRNGVVTLKGNLPSFFLKQLAQRIAMGVYGVEQVMNDIWVDGIPG